MTLKDSSINTNNNESFKHIALITHLLSNVAQSLCWQFHLHEAMSLCQREGWAFEVEIVDEYCSDDEERWGVQTSENTSTVKCTTSQECLRLKLRLLLDICACRLGKHAGHQTLEIKLHLEGRGTLLWKKWYNPKTLRLPWESKTSFATIWFFQSLDQSLQCKPFLSFPYKRRPLQ